MVLNRLNKPSDGDIVVPQRATSTIGTTSWKVEDLDLIEIPPEHVEKMIDQGSSCYPPFERYRCARKWLSPARWLSRAVRMRAR